MAQGREAQQSLQQLSERLKLLTHATPVDIEQ